MVSELDVDVTALPLKITLASDAAYLLLKFGSLVFDESTVNVENVILPSLLVVELIPLVVLAVENFKVFFRKLKPALVTVLVAGSVISAALILMFVFAPVSFVCKINW
jgi:hypothetical protein